MLTKSSILNIKKTLSPRSVYTVKMDGKPIDDVTLRNVQSFFLIYVIVIIISTFLVSIGQPLNGEYSSFSTNFSAVIACFNNIGPGIGAVGPTGNFAGYNIFAKLVLCFDMLLGRLEIFPILLLFTPNSWKKAQNKIQGAKKRTIRKIVKKYGSRELERDALENEIDDQVEAENSENVFAEERIPKKDERND